MIEYRTHRETLHGKPITWRSATIPHERAASDLVIHGGPWAGGRPIRDGEFRGEPFVCRLTGNAGSHPSHWTVYPTTADLDAAEAWELGPEAEAERNDSAEADGPDPVAASRARKRIERRNAARDA